MSNKIKLVSLMLLLTGITFSNFVNANTAAALDKGFWHNVYDYGEMSIKRDEIHLISSGNWFLLSKKTYGNFELTAEVKMPDVSEYSNSGIIFRAQVGEHSEKGRFAYGYQAEVDPSDRKWSGGLYDQGTKRQWLHPVHQTRSFPDEHFIENYSPIWSDEKSNAYKHLEWNQYRILAAGPIIKIWVNGVLTTHVKDTTFTRGHIGIQHHGSQDFVDNQSRANTVRFRNIVIKELN